MPSTTELERSLRDLRRELDDVRRESRLNAGTLATAIRKTRAQVQENELQTSIRRVRPSATPLLWDPRTGDFVDPNLSTSLISRLRAGDPVTSRLGTDTSTMGLRNFFADARLISGEPSLSISLNDGLVHQANYDWRAIAAFGTTGGTAAAFKGGDLDTPAQNPLSTATMALQFSNWTAAGVASIRAKSNVDRPSFDATVLPYAVFSVVVYKNPLWANVFTNMSACTVRLVIRNATDTADLVANVGVDFKAMTEGEYTRLWVVLDSAVWDTSDVIPVVVVDMTTTGSGGGADITVDIGDPQFELAPEQAPTIFLAEPTHSQVINRSSATPSTTPAMAVRLFTDTGLIQNSRLTIGLSSALEGSLGFGSGAATQDVRFKRNSAGELYLDTNGVAVVADFKIVPPAAKEAYASIVGRATKDALWRVYLSGDTAERISMGQSGSTVGLFFGAGSGATDIKISRGAAGRLQLDANGAAAGTVLDVLAAAGQASWARFYVAGDTVERLLLSADANWPAIAFGPGNAAKDWLLRRSGAKTALIDDAGGGAATLNLVGGPFQISGTQILTTRRTGWTAPTGTAQRGTFATDTVTLINLARAVKALEDDLITHGIIGA